MYFLLWVVAQSKNYWFAFWGQKYYKTVWVPELQPATWREGKRWHDPLSTESSVAGRCTCGMSARQLLLGPQGCSQSRGRQQGWATPGLYLPIGLHAQLFKVLHWKPCRHRGLGERLRILSCLLPLAAGLKDPQGCSAGNDLQNQLQGQCTGTCGFLSYLKNNSNKSQVSLKGR